MLRSPDRPDGHDPAAPQDYRAADGGRWWTGFTRHFTHLKTGDTAKDKTLLMTTILADGINLGLTKMAESCPGTTYAKLSWLQAWHVRDETYSTALAELVNAQFRHPLLGTGATAPRHRRTVRTSEPAARPRAQGISTRSMGAVQGGRFIPISPINTRPSAQRWSTSACAIRPMCSMACCTTSPTCVLRNTTQTRRASPTMCSV